MRLILLHRLGRCRRRSRRFLARYVDLQSRRLYLHLRLQLGEGGSASCADYGRVCAGSCGRCEYWRSWVGGGGRVEVGGRGCELLGRGELFWWRLGKGGLG